MINGEDMDEAAAFYCSLFDDGRVTGSNDHGADAGEWAGTSMVERLELNGQPFVLLNGGATTFTPDESVSFVQVDGRAYDIEELRAAYDGR